MKPYDAVKTVSTAVKQRITPRQPKLGLVLGSGLGSFADSLTDAVAIPYQQLPGLAQSAVIGHKGQFVAGNCGTTPVLAMQGRVHLYEGHPVQQVVLPIRTMIDLGCTTLIITNAAGGIRADLSPGDLALITDHVNFTGINPLWGANDDRLGVRFPDMSEAYDLRLRDVAKQVATRSGISLTEGVYGMSLGPCYETPAEVRYLRAVGVDLCGMSTVPETIAAVHMGARVLGISCVTNKAAGLGGKLSHDEVEQTASSVRDRFIALLTHLIGELADA